MKKDIDALMRKAKVKALFASGKSSTDPVMYYLLNGVNVAGIYVKKQGYRPYLIHSSIEREVAQATGYRLINVQRYDANTINEKYPDRIKAQAVFIRTILEDLGIRGTVAFYGAGSPGTNYHMLHYLVRLHKAIRIYRSSGRDILSTAMETKDKQEIERIRRVRNGVVHAFSAVLAGVQTMKVQHGVIMKGRAKKLLIGDLKMLIREELFKRDFICSDGLIVSQGRDAGVPHNDGQDRQPVRLGTPIVFDIFPQELGGGYCFDFTRTVCFGHAPRRVKELYATVRDAQDYSFELLKVGRRFTDIERSVCTFFEKRGHATLLSTPGVQHGYCHSLGHGIGLNIHESPGFGLAKTNTAVIRPGHMFTIEPGLYYPDEKIGVRLEDVVYVDTRGRMVNLTRYPRHCVVEM